MTAARVLLLSAVEPNLRPDTDLRRVLEDLRASLAHDASREVIHEHVSELAGVERAVRATSPDVVVNACETLHGESDNEAAVAAALERLGVAFTGSTAACLRLCQSKTASTEALRRAGIRVPRTVAVAPDAPAADLAELAYPVIVKPEREDGSVGIVDGCVARDADGVRCAVLALARSGHAAVAQEYVDGREIALALIGWPEPRVLPPGEILFDERTFAGRPRILTYASKWDEASADYHGTRSVAATTSPELFGRLSRAARRAFDVVGMRDYGRVDFRVDAAGEPFVIDVNPNCDLSRDGGFMRAASRAELDHARAVDVIVEGALARGARRTPP